MNSILYTLLNSNPAIEVELGVGQHRIMAGFWNVADTRKAALWRTDFVPAALRRNLFST